MISPSQPLNRLHGDHRWLLQEWERAYVLVKARRMLDGAHTIRDWPAAIRAPTTEEAKRRRVEAALTYLKGRVERGEELPEVEAVRVEERETGWSSQEGIREGVDEEELRRAVAGHVLEALNADLVADVLAMMG